MSLNYSPHLVTEVHPSCHGYKITRDQDFVLTHKFFARVSTSKLTNLITSESTKDSSKSACKVFRYYLRAWPGDDLAKVRIVTKQNDTKPHIKEQIQNKKKMKKRLGKTCKTN